MEAVLKRLLDALPQVADWVADLHAQHADNATPVSKLGFANIERLLPRSLLDHARAVLVDVVPFPPVASLGLPEFETMAKMPMGGITFGDMYFVHRDHWREPIHFHELAHVIQWQTLGFDTFLSTYALEIIQGGYFGSPLEAVAIELQRRFESAEELPEDVLAFVAWHARERETAARVVFDAFGLGMSRRTARCS